MAIRRGRFEVFHDDQLVVALPDLDLVTQALSRLGVRIGPVDRSRALRLALLRDLGNIEGAVRVLQQDSDTGPLLDRLRADRGAASPAGAADLDLLVHGVTRQLGQRYPGWSIDIGKNYRPSYVKGYPHVGGGGTGDPEPAETAPARPVPGPGLLGGAGHDVRVAVLDTRIFPAPELAGSYVARPGDILDPKQEDFTAFDGHCTFVSSCILQRAPSAEIHVRPVLDSAGGGSAWNAAVALAEMAETGVDVVNLSFGEIRTDDNSVPMVMEAAVRRFGPDTVIVAAAGNNGAVGGLPAHLVPEGVRPNSASYPAGLADVVAVGALGRDGELATFTPYPAPWIRLLAPGTGLAGTYLDGNVTIEHKDRDGRVMDSRQVRFGGQAVWEGCSFAAGVVSGAIAAGIIPGHRPARQVLEELLQLDPARRDIGIRPNDPADPNAWGEPAARGDRSKAPS